MTLHSRQADDQEAARRRRRILFSSPVPDFKGGAERSLLDLLANPDVEAHLAVPGPGPLMDHALAAGTPVFQLPYGAVLEVRRPFRFRDGWRVSADALKAALALKRLCRRHRIAAVHSNGLKAHVVSILARRLGGAPAVVHLRDIPSTRAERLVWRAVQLAADRIVLVSHACWRGRLPGNAAVIHNGVVCPPPRPGKAPVLPARLGFVGRIHPAKGLHVLLEWVAGALAAGLAVRLVVRGRFAAETPDYEATIRRRIAALGLAEQVTLAGFVADPRQVYAGIDIVCVPSTEPDPFPRAVMEAMALGLPVIARPAGGIPEMIESGRTGWLVTDAQGFTDALRRLLTEPGLAARIGADARDRCATAFSIPRLHRELSTVYDGLRRGRPLAARRPGPAPGSTRAPLERR